MLLISWNIKHYGNLSVLKEGNKTAGFILIFRTWEQGHRRGDGLEPCFRSLSLCVNDAVTWTNSAWRPVLCEVRSRPESRGRVDLVWECTQRRVSQWGLALIALLSFGQKRQTKWEREHSRVRSNFSERTRCENALNLPDASSGVVLSISTFPPCGSHS